MVLPVWNGERFLARAIESVLLQTLDSLELIVVDDGSLDRSVAIAQELAERDPRAIVIRLQHRGFAHALNAGIEAARAPYVARMDADDIALPERLRKQVEYLDAHEDCVVVGSGMQIVDDAGKHVGWRTLAESHEDITAALLIGSSPLAHPTVVIRRDALVAVGCYDGRLYPSEDLDLWIKLGEVGRLANIAEVLLQYRRHEDAVSVRYHAEQLAMAERIVNEVRKRRGLHPLHRRYFSTGRTRTARYHFECARAALLAGPRLTAIRHACASLFADPLSPQLYANLIACAVPQRMLRLVAVVRARFRLLKA